MDERLNLGTEVRELKLGSTFGGSSSSRSSTSFHTLKYDFKPASVDLSKVATLDVSSNNQVTVTVPHLDSSGVPKTVFKGNQRNYTKECVLIIDKITGEITLEKLNHNIQVKKTRSESTNKPQPVAHPPPAARASLENSTQRTVSKTKVSTGVRKNALSGIVQRHSPIQGSPSYPHHRSPQAAPVWNANNNQQTLPSIPMIGMDDDIGPPNTAPDLPMYQQPQQQHQHHYQQQQQQHYQSQMQQQHHSGQLPAINNHMPMSSSSSSSGINSHQSSSSGSNSNNYHHHHHHSSSSNHHNNSNLHQQPLQQQQQLQHPQKEQHQINNEVPLLSSSDSSSGSGSESSGSGSDSDDNDNDNKLPTKHHSSNHHQQEQHHHHNHHQNHSSGGVSSPINLHEDLRLSESNSSDSDD